MKRVFLSFIMITLFAVFVGSPVEAYEGPDVIRADIASTIFVESAVEAYSAHVVVDTNLGKKTALYKALYSRGAHIAGSTKIGPHKRPFRHYIPLRT